MKAKKIGVYLRKIREKRGITQEQLAFRAGITQATICRIERGDIVNPKFFDVIKLLKVMRSSPAKAIKELCK